MWIPIRIALWAEARPTQSIRAATATILSVMKLNTSAEGEPEQLCSGSECPSRNGWPDAKRDRVVGGGGVGFDDVGVSVGALRIRSGQVAPTAAGVRASQVRDGTADTPLALIT